MRKFLVFAYCSLFFVPVSAKVRVHTIGDSTMSEYKVSATPKRGWGMYLQAFFNADSVEVNNRGKSGASTRTFYETENLWPSVKEQFRSGDYLIIQFAHNDEKCKGEDVFAENEKLRAEGKDTLTDMRGTEPNTTYKAYLFKFINEARGYGVTPILMSPICRAYFQKDGKINDEGRHKFAGTVELSSKDAAKVLRTEGTYDKDYVRCMREVAEDMHVPFLGMTEESKAAFEFFGKDYCMAHYFNCGDKTHTSGEGGLGVAMLAAHLIKESPRLEELQGWMIHPAEEELNAYAQRIEDSGKQAAFDAPGISFTMSLKPVRAVNMFGTKKGYLPAELEWPAGEVDEVANRYVEYELSAPKKKALVIEGITLPVKAKGGAGMNLHINYGFGDSFRGVTTIYENTALPKNKRITVELTQPVLVPAGETIKIRILPWYDSNGKPQDGKYLQLDELTIKGKRLL